MIDFKNISFKEIIATLKNQGIVDGEGNLIKKVEKERTYDYQMFIKNSGLSTDEAYLLLEYSLYYDIPELSEKILKASKI